MTFSLPRRGAVRALAALAVLALPTTLLAAPSQADDRTPLLVVGTSDVSDSDLMSKVIKPGFEAAHPQYRLDYTGTGTGQAIAAAKTGSFSALIVHAASVENQFVADGYSNEQYGRAIFWGDFVMTGPTGDPATVKATDEHDIVGAYEKIAAAGANGDARFVSRGGTPGTTIQEHAIWALTGDINGAADGNGKCTVTAANGGGERPSTVAGTCSGEANAPAWYTTTGKKQAANILDGNACNFDPKKDNCYVFTDRGTFNNLEGQNTVGNLKVVTRTNDSAVRGGGDVLVNKFHAYVMNPKANYGTNNVSIDTAGGTALLDWITSPAGQKAIGGYLPADPPFLPAAAPKLTTSAVPAIVKSGRTVTFTGSISNETPGTLPLSGVQVQLKANPQSNLLAPATTVAVATTDATGAYSFTYKPQANQFYSVAVPQITKIQDPTLNPPFGDLLTGTSRELGLVKVQSAPRLSSAKRVSKHVVRLKGRLSPRASGTKARVYVYGVPTKNAGKRAPKYLGGFAVKNGASTFNKKFKLSNKKWKIQVSEVNPGVVEPGRSNSKIAKKR